MNSLDIGGKALASFTVRMNTIASNLANATTVSSSEQDAFRGLKPVFRAVYADSMQKDGAATVVVDRIVENQAPVEQRYEPGHEMADSNGYIYLSNVEVTDELVDLVELRNQYQSAIKAMTTTKSLMLKTLNLGG